MPANILKWGRYEDVVIEYHICPEQEIIDWTVVFSIAASRGGERLFEATAEIPLDDDDLDMGYFLAAVPSATNGTLPAGVYYYEFRRTDAGFERVLDKGTLVLDQEYTEHP